jgi:hypothetical protein
VEAVLFSRSTFANPSGGFVTGSDAASARSSAWSSVDAAAVKELPSE